MPLALTCDCGARFEVEDLFAAREVSCPECQHRLRAPTQAGVPAPVSLLALYSLALAIIGAFTLVGSVAAVLLAGVALVRLRRPSPRLAGAGYALAALAVAVAGAGVTLGVLYHPATARLSGWLRERGVAGQLDTDVPAQVGSRDNACVLTRPAGWGRLRHDRGVDPTIDTLQVKRDLLLASPRGDAYIDVQRDPSPDATPSLSGYGAALLRELQTPPPPLFAGEENYVAPLGPIRLDVRAETDLPAVDGFDGYEVIADLRRGGRPWRWLIRVFGRKVKGRYGVVYVVRAYAPQGRFAAVEPELRRALDSVRFPP